VQKPSFTHEEMINAYKIFAGKLEENSESERAKLK
jgi:hypothetical protein